MILHLFKKVYLTFDIDIDPQRNRLVFSENFGYKMSVDLQDFFSGKCFESEKSIDDLIGEEKKFKDFTDFFSYINNLQTEHDSRLFIYCDINSYQKIITSWFKLIFKNVDANSCLNIINLLFLKRKLLATRNTSIQTIANTSNYYDEMIKVKNNFVNTFNQTNLGSEEKIVAFYNKIKNFISIEYLLTTYLFNKSNKVLFKNVLSKMINRMLEDAVKEIVLNLFDIVMVRKTQEKMGLKQYTSENIMEIFQEESLKDLFETNTWRYIDEQGNFDRVDFTKLSVEKKNKIKNAYMLIVKSVYSDISAEENYEHNRVDYMYYLKEDGISDEDLNKIIENECRFEMETNLWSAQDQESINLFFTQMALEKYSQNKINELEPYVLR